MVIVNTKDQQMTTRHRASTSTRWHFTFALCCYSNSNETRAPIANLSTSAQLGGNPTILPSYIRIRAVVWACCDGHTHTHTDTQTHRRVWPIYISCRLRLTTTTTSQPFYGPYSGTTRV